MRVSITQGGRVLREHRHNREMYVEAPPAGDYAVRITNDGPTRRMAVLSVDGINVLNGADAGFDGPGYVLDPWASVDVPGWHRDGKEVAAFTFKEQAESYAAQTGRGTRNVGVIGVAVFDEKPRPAPTVIREEHHHHHYDHWPWRPRPRPSWKGPWAYGSGILRSMSSVTLSAAPGAGDVRSSVAPDSEGIFGMQNCDVTKAVDIGTAYGQATAFHTVSVTFERASSSPAEVIALRYATCERLRAWGVPVDEPASTSPQAFPLSQGCPSPPGWRG